jgi:hypothetical protein
MVNISKINIYKDTTFGMELHSKCINAGFHRVNAGVYLLFVAEKFEFYNGLNKKSDTQK